MELSAQQKEILMQMGYTEKDFAQIEGVMSGRNTTYTLGDKSGNEKRISREQALELLGMRKFLAGISRSAFHWDATQDIDEGGTTFVGFDSSKYLKQ